MSAAAQQVPFGAQSTAAELGADDPEGLSAAPRPHAAAIAKHREQHHGAEDGPQQRQPHQGRRPLSFGRWFAREARATDIIVLLAEVLLINWLHAVRLGEARHCGGGGGALGDGEGGGAAGGGSSSSSSAFPCAGGLVAKLLWSLTSGAVLDPRLRLQQWDHCNLVYIWAQLAVVLIALLAPALYERCRTALMAGVGVAMLLVMHWSLWAAPPGPFPLNSCILLSAACRRVGCVYMGWKSATVFRVPARDQLLVGPLLWLLMAAALPLADRRMPPPGGGGGGGEGIHGGGGDNALPPVDGRRMAADVAILFVAIAALPYMLCRAWEVMALRPAYHKYLLLREGCGGGGGAQHHRAATCAPEAGGGAEPAGKSRADNAAAGAGAAVADQQPCGGGAGCNDDDAQGGDDGGAAGGSSDDCCSLSSLSGAAFGSSSNSGSGWAYRLMGRSGSAETGLAAGPAAAAAAASPVPAAVTTGAHAAATADTPASSTKAVPTSSTSQQESPLPWVAAPPPAAALPGGNGGGGAAGTRSGQRPPSVLYRSSTRGSNGVLALGRSRSHTALVSLKVPVRHRGSEPGAGSFGGEVYLPTFQEASAAVLRSAAAALDAHNRRACEQRRLSADAPAGPPPALRCLSAVCVDGCVQLLMVVHVMAAGEEARAGAASEEEEDQGLGQLQLQLQPQPLVVHGQAAASAEELAAAVEPDVTASITAALQQLLVQVGVDEVTAASGGSATSSERSSPAAAAFCWPPALPLGAAATDNGHTAGSHRETEEAVLVLLQLPTDAPARGLRSVRCVLVDNGGVAGGGGANAAAAVAHVDAELPLHLLLQPPVAAGGEVEGSEPAALAYVRLPVPPRARLGPAGLRILHLLPPRARGTAAAAPAGPGTVGGMDSNASGGDTAAVADSTAPLAALPLLVVGPEAAAELQQLHGQVLGPEAVAQLQQLTCTEAVAGVASASEAGSSSSSRAAAEALSAAAAALQHSGLTSLVLDLGALLQLPVGGDGLPSGGGEEEAVPEAAAAGFNGLLRFLAAHRMAGCLREALVALRRAGVQLQMLVMPAGERKDGEGAVAGTDASPHPAAAAAGCGSDSTEQVAAVDTLVAAPRPVAMTYKIGSAAAARVGKPGVVSHAVQQPGGSLICQLVWWLRILAFGFLRASAQPAPDQHAGSSSGSQQPEPRSGQSGQQPSIRSSSSSSPEAAYLAYKAASCRSLDCMSLIAYTAMRVVSLMRTCNADAVATPATAAVSAASVAATSTVATFAARMRAAMSGRGLAAGLWRAMQLVVGAARPPAPAGHPDAFADGDGGRGSGSGGGGGGCPRPYLEGCCGGVTVLDLHIVAQSGFLAAGVLLVLLATFTQLHARRRNAFLLLRAGLDAAAMTAMVLPLPRWPAPLLGVPQCWLDNNRRTGMHWMVFGLYEPLTLQVSPYVQAAQGALYLMPMTLIGFHTYGCRWRPALHFGLGYLALTLAVSAATDAASRALYLRRAHRGSGAGGSRSQS